MGKNSKVMGIKTTDFLPTRLGGVSLGKPLGILIGGALAQTAFAQALVGKNSKVLGIKTLEFLPTRPLGSPARA